MLMMISLAVARLPFPHQNDNKKQKEEKCNSASIQMSQVGRRNSVWVRH